MFRLLCGVFSFLKCMCYHCNVVFTTAGGQQRVREERRGNARHSKMSKIHALGRSVFTSHKLSRGGKTHFNINGRQAGSLCLYISFYPFFFFFARPHGNIQQKPRDEFCREVRMSMLIFFPLLRRHSLRGPDSLPHGHCAFSQRSFSVSSLIQSRNQTWRNISVSGCSVDRETPTSGSCIDFHWRGGCLPSELFTTATLAHHQSSAVIVLLVF